MADASDAPVDAAPVETPEVAQPEVKQAPQRNKARLQRVFRAAKDKPAARAWRAKPQAEEGEELGVSAAFVDAVAAALTDEEKERAKAGKNPATADELAREKRAARFGEMPAEAKKDKEGKAKKANDEKGAGKKAAGGKKARELKPTTIIALPVDDEAAKKRAERFGVIVDTKAATAPTISAEVAAQRAARFAAAAPAATTTA